MASKLDCQADTHERHRRNWQRMCKSSGTFEILGVAIGTGLSLSGGVLTATGAGSGTVTSVSVVTANGVSGSVATATTTPAITITLGAITPTSVAAVGTVTGSNLSGTNTGDQTSIVGITGTLAQFNTALTGADFATGGGTATGTNTGDQTITLTGDVTGSGTGSFATTLATVNANVGTFNTLTVNAKGLVTAASNTAYSTTTVATDVIWDAKGDLAVGTGANTAVRLPVGANGYVLYADSTTTEGMEWRGFDATTLKFNAGDELAVYWSTSGGLYEDVGTYAGMIVRGFRTQAGNPTDPTLVDGDTWYDTTDKSFEGYQAGAVKQFTGLMYTNAGVSDDVASNGADEAFSLSWTMPANFLTVGKMLHIRGAGRYTVAGTPTLTIKIKYGSTTIFNSGALAINLTANTPWYMDLTITTFDVGAASTQLGNGIMGVNGAAGMVAVRTGANDINSTASQVITITANWGGAGNSAVLETFTITAMN